MDTTQSVYVIKLIDGSELLNDAQKQQMKDKLSTLSAAQLADLIVALENEHKALQKYYRNVAHIHKIAAEKKIKAYYDGAEKVIQQKEETEIENIESELANF